MSQYHSFSLKKEESIGEIAAIHKSPTLSICIPTYNRCEHLDSLLSILTSIKLKLDSKVEICISDNNSTDRTEKIVWRWSRSLQIKYHRNSSNIGSNANIRNVTGLATGEWVLVIGDDDQLIEESLIHFVNFIEHTSRSDWFLLRSLSGDKILPRKIAAGIYEPFSMVRHLITHGLFDFGFIGTHVFHRRLVQEYLQFSPDLYQSWPHLALFLSRVFCSKTHIFPEAVVVQSAANVAYFSQGDWVVTNLSKVRVIHELGKSNRIPRLLGGILIIRELYDVALMKDFLLWRLLDEEDFNSRGYGCFNKYYRLSIFLRVCSIPHWFVNKLLAYTPSRLVLWVLRVIRKHVDVSSYQIRKEEMRQNDMVRRGM